MHTGLPKKDEPATICFFDLTKKETSFKLRVNQECEKYVCMHSVQSSLKSHPLRVTLYIGFNNRTEAVPSINYIGLQLDVSYIGRQMYGEIYQIQIRI